jgi:uncharacterized protein YbcI
MTGTEADAPAGDLNARISTAVVQVLREFTGRGPTRARTTYVGDLISVLLQDTLTPGERALVADDKHETVLAVRTEYQDTMRERLTSEIEELTGRHVLAFLSANHIDPDLGVETFVLAPADPAKREDGAATRA